MTSITFIALPREREVNVPAPWSDSGEDFLDPRYPLYFYLTVDRCATNWMNYFICVKIIVILRSVLYFVLLKLGYIKISVIRVCALLDLRPLGLTETMNLL